MWADPGRCFKGKADSILPMPPYVCRVRNSLLIARAGGRQINCFSLCDRGAKPPLKVIVSVVFV